MFMNQNTKIKFEQLSIHLHPIYTNIQWLYYTIFTNWKKKLFLDYLSTSNPYIFEYRESSRFWRISGISHVRWMFSVPKNFSASEFFCLRNKHSNCLNSKTPQRERDPRKPPARTQILNSPLSFRSTLLGREFLTGNFHHYISGYSCLSGLA